MSKNACPHCGAENTAVKTVCWKCKGALGPASSVPGTIRRPGTASLITAVVYWVVALVVVYVIPTIPGAVAQGIGRGPDLRFVVFWLLAAVVVSVGSIAGLSLGVSGLQRTDGQRWLCVTGVVVNALPLIAFVLYCFASTSRPPYS